MIERTFDTTLVRSILSDETLRERGGKYVSVEAYDPENQKEIIYLLAKEGEVVLGVICFHIFNHPICYQAHVNYLPRYWGTGLIEHTKASVVWMFENTPCLKIVALIPDAYPEVIRHAEKTGLTVEGYLRNSIMVKDKLDNQVLMGIEKWEQQQQ